MFSGGGSMHIGFFSSRSQKVAVVWPCTNKQIDRQTDRQIHRQRNRPTDKADRKRRHDRKTDR